MSTLTEEGLAQHIPPNSTELSLQLSREQKQQQPVKFS